MFSVKKCHIDAPQERQSVCMQTEICPRSSDAWSTTTTPGNSRRKTEFYLTLFSVPKFFWLRQKWVYQNVQRLTGLTHPF